MISSCLNLNEMWADKSVRRCISSLKLLSLHIHSFNWDKVSKPIRESKER